MSTPTASPEDITACSACTSENTTPAAEMVPSGTHSKRLCRDCGLTTNGIPPARLRGGPTRRA